jgi:dephospho-CoA kinase
MAVGSGSDLGAGLRPLYRVALTGGLAAGKSSVAARLRRFGLRVVDHDQLARDAVAVGSAGLAAVLAEFGARFALADGSLDRAALGRVVFGDAGARARLEVIVHPLIAALADAGDDAARAAGERVVVHDIPLLVETGTAGDYDLVVAVAAPVEVRVARAVARGLAEPDARARIAAQAPESARKAIADIILDASGPIDTLNPQVDTLINELRTR